MLIEYAFKYENSEYEKSLESWMSDGPKEAVQVPGSTRELVTCS